MSLCVCFVSCKRKERKLNVKPVKCNFKKIIFKFFKFIQKECQNQLLFIKSELHFNVFLLSEKVSPFSRQLLLINVIIFIFKLQLNIMIVLEENQKKQQNFSHWVKRTFGWKEQQQYLYKYT